MDIVERLHANYDRWFCSADDTQLLKDAANEIERLRNLYRAVNTMMAALGYHGTISADDDHVSAVMDALHEIDGGQP